MAGKYRSDGPQDDNKLSTERRCSWLSTAIITVLVAVVVGVVVGVSVAFGRKCNESSTGDSTTTVSPLPTSTTLPPPSGEELRLPTSIIPTNYDVTIRPIFDLQSNASQTPLFNINGSVRITFTVVQVTSIITLHAKMLDIDESSIAVRSSSGDVIEVQNSWSDDRLEFYHLLLRGWLKEGDGLTLSMKFTGRGRDDLAGLYGSSYRDEDNFKHLVTSHLHPTEARSVFPCFDEPALKATFNVTLERKNDSTISFSNTKIYETTELEYGWVADHYLTTPPMSSYLLAFVISDFSCLNTTTDHNKEVFVCVRRNAIDQAEYAVSIAGQIQSFYENHFNVSYPLPQTLHVAIPDFPAGAMENWGCILYRETSLLYDPMTSSTYNKQRVATVISHELSHMWFGDLVTPGWWDDIWLNEGFASYMEYTGVNSVQPEWNMDDQFLSERFQPVLQIDSLATSHPIYQEVSNPNEINQLFDSISYSKGASVIRMMKYFLGEEIFDAGITAYLQSRSYNVSHHMDLFDALTQKSAEMGSNLNVSAIMLTWILQMGYPVIYMSYDNATGIVSLRQERFLTYNPSKISNKSYHFLQSASPYNYTWSTPISVASDVSGEFDNATLGWLNSSAGTLSVPVGAQWIVGNVYSRYYYRVTYDTATWSSIANQLQLNHTLIPTSNRAQIIDDVFSLARPGVVSQILALNISRYLISELDYVPWTAAVRSFGYIRRMMTTTSSLHLLESYVQTLLGPVYQSVGWAEEINNDTDSATSSTHLKKLLRAVVTEAACQFGINSCLTEASEHLQRIKHPNNNVTTDSLSVDLMYVTYCYGVSEGGVAEWFFTKDSYEKSNIGSERTTLLRAMACTKQAALLDEYLYLALAGDVIKYQDFSTVITSVSKNRISGGEAIAWDFLRLNWNEIYNLFGETSLYTLSNIVSGVTESFANNRRLNELRTFMNEQAGRLGTAERAFEQAVEMTEANIEWMTLNEQDVIIWLQDTTDI